MNCPHCNSEMVRTLDPDSGDRLVCTKCWLKGRNVIATELGGSK